MVCNGRRMSRISILTYCLIYAWVQKAPFRLWSQGIIFSRVDNKHNFKALHMYVWIFTKINAFYEDKLHVVFTKCSTKVFAICVEQLNIRNFLNWPASLRVLLRQNRIYPRKKKFTNCFWSVNLFFMKAMSADIPI